VKLEGVSTALVGLKRHAHESVVAVASDVHHVELCVEGATFLVLGNDCEGAVKTMSEMGHERMVSKNLGLSHLLHDTCEDP
jgi:hypothetical protein